MTDVASPGLPRLLLAGEVGLRPDGLERALTRAGFRVCEGTSRESDAPADAILLTVAPSDRAALAELLGDDDNGPPRVVLLSGTDPELAGAALELGADDAVLAPVYLPELCARLHARIRDRQAPRRTTAEREARGALEHFVAEARATLLPEEIVLALLRRLARAFDLAGCAFVVPGSGDRGRVVAETGSAAAPSELDLRGYPEILEALRTRRAHTSSAPGAAPTLAVPVWQGEGQAVLLLRVHEGRPPLGAAQVALAGGLGEAAARALATAGRLDGGASLERRLHEEFERARRYSLSFALILVAVDALESALGGLDEDSGGRLAADVAAELRRTLRLPDFVGRYTGAGFAIVLPETDAAGARRSVSRLRERLAALPLEPDGRRTGLSAGIVAYPHPAVTQPDDMFALVEAALKRGRAQVGERVGIAD